MLVAVAARQHDGGSRQQDDHSYDGDADDIAAGAADCGTDPHGKTSIRSKEFLTSFFLGRKRL